MINYLKSLFTSKKPKALERDDEFKDDMPRNMRVPPSYSAGSKPTPPPNQTVRANRSSVSRGSSSTNYHDGSYYNGYGHYDSYDSSCRSSSSSSSSSSSYDSGSSSYDSGGGGGCD